MFLPPLLGEVPQSGGEGLRLPLWGRCRKAAERAHNLRPITLCYNLLTNNYELCIMNYALKECPFVVLKSQEILRNRWKSLEKLPY